MTATLDVYQKEVRFVTLTLTGLQIEALEAFSHISEPEPCFTHTDDDHGNFSDCDGYAEEFQEALWQGYDALLNAWRRGTVLENQKGAT